MPVLVQLAGHPDEEPREEAGHLVEQIHAIAGAVSLVHVLAGQDLLFQLGVEGVQGLLRLCVEKRQPFLGAVVELLLHHKGGGHFLPLVHGLVGDEAVHLGTQGDGLDDGGYDEMEDGVREFRLRLVLLSQIGVDGRQIHPLGNVSLVVTAVGVDVRHDVVHGVQVADEIAILSISPVLFSVFHG